MNGSTVVYTWSRTRRGVAHLAAGRGNHTACGVEIRPGWMAADEVPADRALCRRCAAMQNDTEATGAL